MSESNSFNEGAMVFPENMWNLASELELIAQDHSAEYKSGEEDSFVMSKKGGNRALGVVRIAEVGITRAESEDGELVAEFTTNTKIRYDNLSITAFPKRLLYHIEQAELIEDDESSDEEPLYLVDPGWVEYLEHEETTASIELESRHVISSLGVLMCDQAMTAYVDETRIAMPLDWRPEEGPVVAHQSKIDAGAMEQFLEVFDMSDFTAIRDIGSKIIVDFLETQTSKIENLFYALDGLTLMSQQQKVAVMWSVAKEVFPELGMEK